MNRLGAGVTFVFIATLLYCTSHVCAAIMGVPLEDISIWPNVFSCIALIIGFYYIITLDKEIQGNMDDAPDYKDDVH